MTLEEPRQGRGRCGDATLGETDAQFLEALVALLLQRRHHRRALPLDPSRPHVATLGLRGVAARRPPRRVPPDDRRNRNAEAARRRATAHAAIHRRKRPSSQIHGKWPAHPVTPIYASGTRNHTSATLGIRLNDLNRWGDALVNTGDWVSITGFSALGDPFSAGASCQSRFNCKWICRLIIALFSGCLGF